MINKKEGGEMRKSNKHNLLIRKVKKPNDKNLTS